MLQVSAKPREIRHLLPRNLNCMKRGMNDQLRSLRDTRITLRQNLAIEMEVRVVSGRWSLRKIAA